MENSEEKVLEAMIKAELYPKTHIAIVSKDLDSNNEILDKIDTIIDVNKCEDIIEIRNKHTIVFKNGSTIECLYPSVSGETIRGSRSNINPFLYDLERINPSVVDEALKDIINIEM